MELICQAVFQQALEVNRSLTQRPNQRDPLLPILFHPVTPRGHFLCRRATGISILGQKHNQ